MSQRMYTMHYWGLTVRTNEMAPGKHRQSLEHKGTWSSIAPRAKCLGMGGTGKLCSLKAIMEPGQAPQAPYGNRAGDTSPEAPQHKEPQWVANTISDPKPGLGKTDLQEDDGACPDKFPCNTGKQAHGVNLQGLLGPGSGGHAFHSSGLLRMKENCCYHS